MSDQIPVYRPKEIPTAGTVKLPANWQGTRCGHNFPFLNCPYESCGARELYNALAAIVEPDGTALNTHHRVIYAARAALAKARGEAA